MLKKPLRPPLHKLQRKVVPAASSLSRLGRLEIQPASLFYPRQLQSEHCCHPRRLDDHADQKLQPNTLLPAVMQAAIRQQQNVDVLLQRSSLFQWSDLFQRSNLLPRSNLFQTSNMLQHLNQRLQRTKSRHNTLPMYLSRSSQMQQSLFPGKTCLHLSLLFHQYL